MTTWHAPPEVLRRYAEGPTALDDPTASSIEAHLLACGECRGVLAGGASPPDLDASWLAVVDAIDRPAPSVLERLLARIGIAEDSARLVGATGALQWGWLAVVAVLAALALLAAADDGSAWAFLVLAPLLPVGAVAVAFLPAADPGGEAGVAAPLHGLGVAVRRVLATTLPTLVLLVVATPFLPTGGAASAAWLLPSLALATSSLLLATAVRVPVAVGVSTAAWIVALWLVRVGDRHTPLERTDAFGRPGQAVAIAVLAATSAALVARRDRFATLEVHW